MTHSIAPNQHSGVGPLPLVEAGVVDDPLPVQGKRLEERRNFRTTQPAVEHGCISTTKLTDAAEPGDQLNKTIELTH